MYKSRYKKVSRRRGSGSKTARFFSLFFKIILPTALVVGLVWFLRADVLQIKNVEVLGNRDVAENDIEKIVEREIEGSYFYFIPRSNVALLREEKIEEAILKNFPRITSVEIQNSFNGDLQVVVEERVGEYLWCQREECFLMDKKGLIFWPATLIEKAGKIIFRGGVVGEPILKTFEGLENYLKAISALGGAGLLVSEAVAEFPNQSSIKTDIGHIILNPEEDMSLAIVNALLLIKEVHSKDPLASFDYIDARFGAKLFYKLEALE